MPVIRGERQAVAKVKQPKPQAQTPQPKPQTATAKDFADPIATLPVKNPAPAPAPSAHDQFIQRRTKAYVRVAKAVNAGKMSPWEGHAALQKAGYIPGGSAYKKPVGVGGTIAKAVGGVADAAAKVAEHVEKPVVKALTPAPAPTGTPVTDAEMRKVPHALYRVDAQGHHYRIGHGDLNAGFVSPGTGIVSQVVTGLAHDATYNPAGIKDAIAHPERTLGHLAHNLNEVRQHPLRHPDQTLLDAWALGSAATGGLSRLAAAAGAAKSEGLAAALTRPTHEGGSLLHQPPPAPRTFELGQKVKPTATSEGTLAGKPIAATRFTVGRKQVELLPSRNKAFNLAQQAHDKVLRRALRVNPEGRTASYATRRLGGSMTEARRVHEELQRVPGQLLDRAGKNLKPEEHLALRMVSENTPIADLRKLHEDGVANTDGYDKSGHLKQLALLQKLEDRGLLTDDGTRMAVNAAEHPHLANADRRLAEGGAQREKILEDTGQMSPEGLKARRDAPARVVSGARYEKPTPAKQGVPSQSLLKARARVARLEALHERAVARASEKAVPYGNVHTRTGLVKQDLKTAPEAAFKRQHVEVEPGPKTPGKPSALPAKGINTPTVERLGAALSVARDELASAEKAAAGRVKETGIVGGASTREGRTRIPYYTAESKPPTAGLSAQGRNGVIGKTRNLVTKKPFTGEGLVHGQVPDNTTGLVAREMQRAAKFLNNDSFRRDIAKAGTTAKQTSRDVLVNTQELKNAHVADETHAALGNKLLTVDELKNHASAFEQYRAKILPGAPGKFVEDNAAGIGTPAPKGHVWVDRNLLGELAKPAGRLKDVAGSRTVGLTDAINNAQKFAITYTKPGHFATRGVTNEALNILHGSAKELPRSVRLWHKLDDTTREQMLALGGQGYSRSVFGADMSAGMKAVAKGANFWARVDDPFRFNAVAYEAAREGFKTPEQLQALFNDPRNAAKVERIGRMAQRENIDYARLGPKEREIVRRVFFYYPWVKGATLYAGRFLGEHPLKAAALANLAMEGEQQAHKDLGDVPSYEAGVMRVGGTDAKPEISNPRSVSLFSTPGQVLDAIHGLAGGNVTRTSQISSFLTPTLKLAADEAFRLGPFGQQLKGNVSSASIAKQDLLSSTPEALLYQRLRDSGALKPVGVQPTKKGSDQSKKMLPTNTAVAIEQPLLGSSFPRPANRDALNAAAEKEQRALMTPAQRITSDHVQAVGTLRTLSGQHWPQILAKGQIPPEWKEAVSLRQQRLLSIANLGIKHGDPHYEQKAYLSDVKLLGKLGKLKPGEVADAARFAKVATEDRLRIQRLRIGHTLFRGAVLSYAKKQLKARGADVSKLPW